MYRGHAFGVEDATYNADGSKIFSRDFGHNFCIWSVETGERLEVVDDEEKKKQLYAEMQLLISAAARPFSIKCRHAEITVKDAASQPVLSFVNVSGLFVQGCDFRNVHPASTFSDAVRKNLRSYGALFSDDDETAWKLAK
jgi:hypothetical protein